ncbi:MAG: hypothetical protein JRH20_23570 [Deltaproteobacteria bacterium]|nr:hypothetical protein [Deltaproteobacteria bacterium]
MSVTPQNETPCGWSGRPNGQEISETNCNIGRVKTAYSLQWTSTVVTVVCLIARSKRKEKMMVFLRYALLVALFVPLFSSSQASAGTLEDLYRRLKSAPSEGQKNCIKQKIWMAKRQLNKSSGSGGGVTVHRGDGRVQKFGHTNSPSYKAFTETNPAREQTPINQRRRATTEPVRQRHVASRLRPLW